MHLWQVTFIGLTRIESILGTLFQGMLHIIINWNTEVTTQVEKCCLQPGGRLWQHKWMQQLGKLLYIVERNRKITAAVVSQPPPHRPHNIHMQQNFLAPQREARSVPRSAPAGPVDPSVDAVPQRPVLRASGQSASRGFPPPYPSRYSPQGSRVGPQAGHKQALSKGANALHRVSGPEP